MMIMNWLFFCSITSLIPSYNNLIRFQLRGWLILRQHTDRDGSEAASKRAFEGTLQQNFHLFWNVLKTKKDYFLFVVLGENNETRFIDRTERQCILNRRKVTVALTNIINAMMRLRYFLEDEILHMSSWFRSQERRDDFLKLNVHMDSAR